MNARLALIVDSMDQLAALLARYLENPRECADEVSIFTGVVSRDGTGLDPLISGGVGEEILKLVMDKKDPRRIAWLWVRDVEIPWARLNGGASGPRVALPTYPFNKRRCWFAETPGAPSPAVEAPVIEAPGVEALGVDHGETPAPATAAEGNGKPGEILLTGATDVLGGSLLKELLANTDSWVHCLVRAADVQEHKRLDAILRVYDTGRTLADRMDKRVTPVVGDLARPGMGLDPGIRGELAEKVDLVIHNAGKVSLHGVYEDVKEVNVDGTARLIDFALETEPKRLLPSPPTRSWGIVNTRPTPRSPKKTTTWARNSSAWATPDPNSRPREWCAPPGKKG